MKNVLVVGTGGLAREFSSYFYDHTKYINIIGFSTTNPEEHAQFNLPGTLFGDEVTPDLVGTKNVIIAIGNPISKSLIYHKLKAKGFSFPSMVHPSSIVSNNIIIEEGVVISPNCVISPNVTLRALSYLNFSCGVGHDAVIGRFVQVNPGTQLGGFTVIGDESLIGSGVVVIHGVNIGNRTTIGSGSVVFSRVVDGATMIGNPAKRLRAFEKQ